MRPVTFQIVDLAAFRSAIEMLKLAHKTAVAVCLDGHRHRFDPTGDEYRHAVIHRPTLRGRTYPQLGCGPWPGYQSAAMMQPCTSGQ